MNSVRAYRVLRELPAGDTVYEHGDVVSDSDWPPRRARQLVERRFLEPIYATSDAPDLTEAKRVVRQAAGQSTEQKD